MTVEDFLAKLHGVTDDGKGGYMACCPAHDDQNPSMHVNRGDDGRVLVKCFAGCTTQQICDALGIAKRDLMAEGAAKSGRRVGDAAPYRAEESAERGVRSVDGATSSDGAGTSSAGTRKAAQKRPRDIGKLVCEYVYCREDGAAVFKVQRRMLKNGKKTFVQMSSDPDAPGGWTFGVASKGVDYIPFKLPLIRRAAAHSKPVVICEGEKDVLSVIERLKMAATCNAKGAGKWQEGWGKYFEGVPALLIIADNDPDERTDAKSGGRVAFAVGQRHACDVERKLRADGYKGEIRKIVMPDVIGKDGKPIKVKDFTDWADAMDVAGKAVDMAAFKAAVAAAGDWPSKWAFGEDDGESAGRRVRSADAGEDAQVGDAPGADGKGCGRFGRLTPRAPSSGVRTYQVDYRLSASLTARFEIGLDFYRFQGFKKSDGDDKIGGRRVEKGDYFLASDNEPLKLSLSSMFAMGFGNVTRFGSGDTKFKFGARQVSELQAAITLLWLRSRGKFFWDDNQKGFATSLFFDERTGVLMRVRSDEFVAFVATESEINRESAGFKFLMSLVDDAAMSDQVAQGVTPSTLWDRKGDAVYISSGDAEMYRIQGGQVAKVLNGTDGVVFMRGKTLAPWILKDGAGIDPFEESLMFKHASWADKNGRMNVRLWVLNLFACHATKPILLITGEMQSGKTRMAKAVKEILGVMNGRKLDLSVQQAEDGEKGLDSFWATVNEGKLEVYDNLDTKIKWVADTLQNVATDGQTKRRTLYTTFGVSILRANAHLIITSNNPLFSTEGNGGMADRLISVHLNMNRSVTMDTELSEDIKRNRDEFMTWIARTVAAALADTGEVDKSINRRHPDYGRFSVRCGRAFGNEDAVIEALGAAEADKALLPLRNDTITKEVLAVLENQSPPYSMRFTAGEMSSAILARMSADETDEKSKQIYGARRVGKAMAKFLRQFSAIFRVSEPRILDGKTLYEFAGLTAAGKLAIGGEVGKVDLQGTFQKDTHIQAGAGAFSENGGLNPLIPLHAHARPGTSSFFEEEEENKKRVETEDDGDDWGIDL